MTAASDSPGDDREARIERVITGYLAALARDNAPSRDELLAEHPDLADDLAAFLEFRSRLRNVASVIGHDGARRPLAVPTLEPGRIVGDYVIVAMIARGGMGVVYRAMQQRLGREVALKLLRDDGANDDDLRRFRREAEAIARLDHPHIVPIHDFGEHEGRRYFSMKLVEGGTLADRIKERIDDNANTARTVATIARAIDHAHQRGILHRDLKPSNILIDDDSQPMVVDFGLAMRFDSETTKTATGLAPGTPAYMAPEQVKGNRDALTPATDVHALGAILYAMLTGVPPFRGDSAFTILNDIRDRPADAPRSIRPEIPRDLETICLKCLEKEPTRRYATAAELADDLDRWLTGRPIRARRVGPIGRSWRTARRHPVVTMMAVVVVAMTAVLLGLFIRVRRREDLDRQLARAVADEEAARDLEEAWRDWSENRLDLARPILDRHRADPGAPLVHNFAWRYLDRLTHIGHPRFRGHDSSVYSAAFSPDGTILATAGLDKTVRLWDRDGTALRILRGHTNEVNQVSFHPDGRRIVTAGEDETVRIWEVPSGRPLKTLTGFADEVVSAIFTPDGKRLITGCRNGDVSFRDTATWKVMRSIRALFAPKLQGLAISPDGSTLAIAANGVEIVDIDTGHKRAWLSNNGPNGESPDPFKRPTAHELKLMNQSNRTFNAVAFTPDGRLLAGSGPFDFLSLWNTRDWSLAKSYPMKSDVLDGIAFSPDSRTLATGGRHGTLYLIDTLTGERELIATSQLRVWGTNFSPDGRRLVTVSLDGTVGCWHLPRDAMRIAFSIPTEEPTSLAISPDGAELTVADYHGGVWIYDLLRLQKKKSLRLAKDGTILRTALSGDGRRIVGVTHGPGIQVWDLPQERQRDVLWPGLFADPLWISGNGRWVVITPHDTIRLWDVERGREVWNQQLSIMNLGLFSPRDDVFSLAVWNHFEPRLVDIRAGSIRKATNAGQVDDLASQAFSADGTRLATGATGGEIIIWDVATLGIIRRLPGLRTKILSLAFTPDGRTLASGDDDHTISLWDLTTGRRVGTLKGHSGPVQHLRFTPDGLTLASIAPAADGTTELFLWPAVPIK